MTTILIPVTITCMMSFRSSQCRHLYKPYISYHNNISYCSELKFLGMNINEKLKWHIHICSLCASLGKVYYIIKSLKDVMSFNMIWTIYYAYFESCMKYGIIFWGRDRDSAKVFHIQKKVIHFISGVYTCDSCRHYFMEYKFVCAFLNLYHLCKVFYFVQVI
jgi:hypothetical protein